MIPNLIQKWHTIIYAYRLHLILYTLFIGNRLFSRRLLHIFFFLLSFYFVSIYYAFAYLCQFFFSLCDDHVKRFSMGENLFALNFAMKCFRQNRFGYLEMWRKQQKQTFKINFCSSIKKKHFFFGFNVEYLAYNINDMMFIVLLQSYDMFIHHFYLVPCLMLRAKRKNKLCHDFVWFQFFSPFLFFFPIFRQIHMNSVFCHWNWIISTSKVTHEK